MAAALDRILGYSELVAENESLVETVTAGTCSRCIEVAEKYAALVERERKLTEALRSIRNAISVLPLNWDGPEAGHAAKVAQELVAEADALLKEKP